MRCSKCQHEKNAHNKDNASKEKLGCLVRNCKCNNYLPDKLYLSSGIRKKDKVKILSQIHEKERSKEQYMLVSTQVVEAGVDISFSHIFREKAPLDSIIQVMGRLNREAETDEARLIVFEYDNEFRPYSQLELSESEKILREAKDSTQLYSSLGQYYKSISEKNETYKKYSSELEYHISRLDFDKIWEFINNHVLDKALENERDIVLIPDMQEWDEIKQILTQKKLTRTGYRRFADISATLPKKIYDLGIVDYFDSEALEKNILLPKKEYLNEVYDDVLGTDKWLIAKVNHTTFYYDIFVNARIFVIVRYMDD